MGLLSKSIFVLALFIYTCNLSVADEYFVFTKSSEPYQLSRQQIKQIFLGGRLEKNGAILQPVVFAQGHPWRTVFNIRVMGLTESRLQSYWAQVKFTGKRTPPTQVENFEQMLSLMEQQGTIGIAHESDVDLTQYQVIFRFSD